MLRMLPVALKDATKDWMKSLPPGAITTFTNLNKEFLQKFSPSSNVSKLMKNIANFQQNDGESLYDAWES